LFKSITKLTIFYYKNSRKINTSLHHYFRQRFTLQVSFILRHLPTVHFRREESLFAVSERGRKDAPRTGNLRVGFFAGFCRRTELIVAKKKTRSQKFNPPAILIVSAKANAGCPEIFHRFPREISSPDRKALTSKLYFPSFDLGTMPSNNDGDWTTTLRG